MERRERSRLRLRAGLAAALAVLLCAGTALGLWIHSENTELTLFSGMGSDVVFLDTDVPKREARALGLLQPDGSLNIDAVLPRVFQDQDFALRYARIAQVHSGV